MKLTWKPKPDAASLPDREAARLFKALGHPVRLRILRLLLVQESALCGKLVNELPVAQSTVSQHLRLLRAVGLIEGKADGPRRAYRLRPRALEGLRRYLQSL